MKNPRLEISKNRSSSLVLSRHCPSNFNSKIGHILSEFRPIFIFPMQNQIGKTGILLKKLVLFVICITVRIRLITNRTRIREENF